MCQLSSIQHWPQLQEFLFSFAKQKPGAVARSAMHFVITGTVMLRLCFLCDSSLCEAVAKSAMTCTSYATPFMQHQSSACWITIASAHSCAACPPCLDVIDACRPLCTCLPFYVDRNRTASKEEKVACSSTQEAISTSCTLRLTSPMPDLSNLCIVHRKRQQGQGGRGTCLGSAGGNDVLTPVLPSPPTATRA